MSKQELKNELHKLIDEVEDEQILNLLKEDLVTYGKEAAFDDLSDLSDEDKAELEELATEDPDKDTITEEEYQKHIAQWRIRLSTKKRYLNKLDALLIYLEKEWPAKIANDFLAILDNCIGSIKINPHLGIKTKIKNTRSILITKHNRLYYRIEKEKLIILNMIDTRRNPKNNPFKKTS